jgi:hypothetical protein
VIVAGEEAFADSLNPSERNGCRDFNEKLNYIIIIIIILLLLEIKSEIKKNGCRVFNEKLNYYIILYYNYKKFKKHMCRVINKSPSGTRGRIWNRFRIPNMHEVCF